MIVNIVNKYGLCPKSAYPESKASCGSGQMNRMLTAKLREFARTLREINPNARASARADMIAWVHRFLASFMGVPPSIFDWTYRTKKEGDKEPAFKNYRNMTPLEFMEMVNKEIEFDINNQVSLVHDPRNQEMTKLTVDRLGNVVNGQSVTYINVGIEELKAVAKKSMLEEEPIWFGCDVGKCMDGKSGAMHPNLFEQDLLFPPIEASEKLNKAERLEYQCSLMTHAMVFTGFDEVDGKVTKWRVENSWGTGKGENGYWVMADAWFDEYMYQVVVDKKHVPEEILKVLEQEAKVLPAWDPMGSLAKL